MERVSQDLLEHLDPREIQDRMERWGNLEVSDKTEHPETLASRVRMVSQALRVLLVLPAVLDNPVRWDQQVRLVAQEAKVMSEIQAHRGKMEVQD